MSKNLDIVRKLQKAYSEKDIESYKSCISDSTMAQFLCSGKTMKAIDNLTTQIETKTHRASKEMEILECGNLVIQKLEKIDGSMPPYVITHKIVDGKIEHMWLNTQV